LNAIDQNSYKTGVHPALTPQQIFQLLGADGKISGSGPGGNAVVPVKEERRLQQRP
jgi:hypothetical protein